jgi:hypothetical protein
MAARSSFGTEIIVVFPLGSFWQSAGEEPCLPTPKLVKLGDS